MLPRKISDIVDNNVKIMSKKLELKKDFFGTTPSPFVGRYNYPNVNVGFLSTFQPKNKDELDNPKKWAKENKDIKDIVGLRSSLINSRFKSNIYAKQEKLNDLTKDIGLASKPVETEVNLKDKPNFHLQTYQHASPSGPNAELKKARITSNPKISQKVDKVNSEHYLKSTEAMNMLYRKGFDENHLSQIMSVGAVGLKNKRKLVPTRWSITATDDTIGKQQIKEVKDFKHINDYHLYIGNFLGNYYIIMLFPEIWSYELFETSLKSPDSYATDYEFNKGRKYYSENCEGGYYTVRLAITEKLKQMKRQATAIAFRFITPEYTAPLGVWVTREAARKTLNTTPYKFSTQQEMYEQAKSFTRNNFNFNIYNFINKSVILKDQKNQKKLNYYFNMKRI